MEKTSRSHETCENGMFSFRESLFCLDGSLIHDIDDSLACRPGQVDLVVHTGKHIVQYIWVKGRRGNIRTAQPLTPLRALP
jgi:hypothetical protein